MKLRFPLAVLLIVHPVRAQMISSNELLGLAYSYRLTDITSRRFPQSRLLQWIDPLLATGRFTSSPAGTSAEGRTVYLYTYGTGTTKILLWSQMHGDESTATMALVDLLNLFANAHDHPLVTSIRTHLTLLMVPMLNPDGAERFQRRTAQQIDMNRDALRLATPEARILKTLQETHRPSFGFNLHDQDPRSTVGQSKEVAAIALLAPAVDDANSDTPERTRAKLVAARIVQAITPLVPGHITRYDDTFEPRAFGDNIQKWGTSTILIESGGWRDDPEKMHLRTTNVVALLAAFLSIAEGDYHQADPAVYETLPKNGRNLFDIVIRGASFKAGFSVPPLTVDIGINVDQEVDSTGLIVPMATIVDVGDLSTFGAYREFDGTGMMFDSTVIELKKSLPEKDLLHLLEHIRSR
ncbi:MAG: peptidase M14 [Bacteroidia bacterium]|nr:MAG: peptidase M14 [Bacteroidia bacterium]